MIGPSDRNTLYQIVIVLILQNQIYNGLYCEVDLRTYCQDCKNNGTCILDGKNITGTGFICECQAGFEGKNCERETDECKKSNPCKNGGICVPHRDITNVTNVIDFSCACPFGHTGSLCETKLRICEDADNPCKNLALCLIEQDDSKTCWCVPDFHGSFCELRYNDCDPAPKCFNGGACIDGVGEFKCVCLSGFFGPSCQCTADNVTEPECSFYANGTAMPTRPSTTDFAHSWFSGLYPTLTLQLPLPSISKGMPEPSEMYLPELATIIQRTPSLPPAIPSPSPYDPGGGEGRDGLGTTAAPIYGSSASILPPGDSQFSQMYPEPFQSITVDGSEYITPTSTEIPLDEGKFTPLSPLPSSHGASYPDYDSLSNGLIQPDSLGVTTPTHIFSTVSMHIPPGIHTVDLTAGVIPHSSLGPSLPDAEITDDSGVVSPTAPFPPPTQTVSPAFSSDIPLSEDPMEQLPEATISPTLPFETTSNSTAILDPSEEIPTSIPDPGVSLLSTPVVGDDLLDGTVLISSPLSESDFETATSGFVGATPTLEPPLSSSTIFPPTLQPNLTDPCLNYCHNNAKCISNTVQPICLCPFKFTGDRCEIPRKKFQSASFTGDSFLSYRLPNTSVINKFYVRSKLATIVKEGILLYTGVGKIYALIFTQNGHVNLHFSCSGSQSMSFVETRTRVDNGFNFTLDFRMELIVQGISQLRCSAEVNVNQSYVMKGEQIVNRDEVSRSAAAADLHPIDMVFLGGVPPFHTDATQNDELVGIVPGFRGCLHELMVNQEEKDIYDDALDGKKVAECSSCPPGYKGRHCQILVCTNNPCQNGATCTYSQSKDDLSQEWDDAPSPTTTASSTTPNAISKPICLCPLGLSGSVCQHKINITKPKFQSISGYSSYIAYDPIPRFIDWFQLKFHFVTKNIPQISLLLYSGNNNIMLMSQGSDLHPEPVSDFFAITFLQGFVVLTWNLGSGTQRIITPSRIDNRLSIHTLFAGRSGRQAWLKVDGMRNVTGKTPGPMYRLNSDSNELYIGGYKSYKFEGLSYDLSLHEGFQGCIFDLGFRVGNRLYLPKARSGRNVKNCFEEDC